MTSSIWANDQPDYLDIHLYIHPLEAVETGASYKMCWTNDKEAGTFLPADWEYSPNENAPFDEIAADKVPIEVVQEYQARIPSIHAEFTKYKLGGTQDV